MSQPASTSIHPALGIDYGDARIGIAATDDFGILAHPVETIPNDRGDPIQRIAELASLRHVRILVIGLPLRTDGSEGDSAAKVRSFGQKLHTRLPDLPLHYEDESFSTTAAAAKLQQAGRKAKHQKTIIDQAAAVEILNRWMGLGY